MNIRYVAFLRGINVGGNKQVKMADLKAAFADLGYTDITTLLNSGNVTFQAEEQASESLMKTIEQHLEKTFGTHIGVLIRTKSEIEQLIDSDPFKGITVTPETRLYVTFLSEKRLSSPKIPYQSEEKYFTILRVTNCDICSVLTLSPGKKTPDLMKHIDKEFGKKVTTRNWNTVTRILHYPRRDTPAVSTGKLK